MRRMKREEENLRKLRHRNIVKLYGSLLVPDELAKHRLFLVMNLCPGNLRKLCDPKLRRQLDDSDIKWIVEQILDGLEFMHSHNIMHR